MVVKTELCNYTEYRIYPGHGQRYIARDGKSSLFITSKVDSLFHQKIRPVRLRWTQAWRRMNKKGKQDEGAKTRKRKAQKFQKAIVGMSLEDIRKKKARVPEMRKEAKETAAREAKARAQAKKTPAKTSAAAKPKASQKKQQATKQGAAPKAPKNQGKR